MGHTHAVIGMIAGMSIGMAMRLGLNPTLVLGSVACCAALAPDIDHPQGKFRRKLGIVGRITLFWLSHRGITHTLPALAVVTLAACHFVPGALALALVVGYSSHLLADLVTVQGLPILWPLSGRSFHLLPYPFRLRTGSRTEWMFAIVMAGVEMWMIDVLMR